MPLRLINPAVEQADAQIKQTLNTQKSQTISAAQAQTFRKQLDDAIAAVQNQENMLRGVHESIINALNQLAQAKVAGNAADITAIEANLTNLWQTWQQTLASQKAADQKVRDRHQQLTDGLGTAAAFSHLETSTPIALFPIRLETRYFAGDANNYELRVRIFPDAIHLDSHQPMFRLEEQQKTRSYWEVRLREGAENELTFLAWQELCDLVGESRAAWLVGQLDPFKGDGRFDSRETETAPPLPPVAVVPEGWAIPTKAKALPDRWAIVGYRGKQRVLLHWTKPIPPELRITPDTTLPGQELQDEPDDLPLEAGVEWLTNFDTAEAVGMAAKIRVPKILARSMERLLVFGVCASQTKEKSAVTLQNLLESHTATGADFLNIGTPTNNTETERTGYRRRDYRQSHQRLLTGTVNDSNTYAVRTAKALGIDKRVFRSVKNSQSLWETDRRSLYEVLWPTTWGSFLRDQLEITVSEENHTFFRNHFINHVRGGGLLPSLRVQAQPYGILPIMAVDQWQSSQNTARNQQFRNGLRSLRNFAASQLSSPRFSPRLFDSEDTRETLTDLLAMTPNPNINMGIKLQFSSLETTQAKMKQWWETVLPQLQNGTVDLNVTQSGMKLEGRAFNLSTNHLELSIPLVSAQADKTLPLANNYIAAFVNHQGSQLPTIQERSIFYFWLRYTYLKLANNPSALVAWQKSLANLQNLSVATLENLLEDLIGACTYRVDPWISSLANLQLEESRTAVPKGVYFGGFGWVEGLEPPGEGLPVIGAIQDDPDSAGYLHLPSLNQAKTAAILHGAYLSHVEQDAGDTLTIDLSAERVKLARWLLDGLRQGQSLSALLGYRFERHLIETDKGEYISTVRAAVPLSVGQIGDSQTNLATVNVVDGLLLHSRWQQNDLKNLNISLIESALLEIDKALDALSDLLMAEGVHHATNGNSARAAAAFDALAEGTALIGEPEVTATPSLGQQIGHQVMVVLPSQALGGWPGDEQRLRSLAGGILNTWAAKVLGNPENIRFRATYIPKDNSGIVQRSYAIAKFDLCPLDIVYLSAAKAESAPLVELLRLFLQMQGPDSQKFTGNVVIDTQRLPDFPERTRSLEEAIALGYALKQLLANSRPLESKDWPFQEEAGNDDNQADPRQATRAQAVQTAFDQIPVNLTANPADIRHWWQAAVVVGPVDPNLADGISGMLASLTQRQVAATAAETSNEKVIAFLGKEFRLVDPVKVIHSQAIVNNFSDQEQQTLLEGDSTKLKRWLQDYGRVRPNVAALDSFVSLTEVFAVLPALKVAQFPQTSGQPWIGERLFATANSPHLSLVAHQPLALNFDTEITGLLVDSWSEVIPHATATTGVAFNYDAPKAQAPQAVLLAVPPALKQAWEFESLEATLLETLDLLKIRGLDPSLLLGFYRPWQSDLGKYLPAIYFPNTFNEDLLQVNG
ncbi:hypothetical protein LC593_11990 [Nostoc sp. CHAB 5844]|nr:hypothetical protein [Nostoc sp. CHAB 5844]